MFEPTYEMKDGPKPMEWEQYRTILMASWKATLDNPHCTENDIQKFLELHPCLLPTSGRPFRQGGWGAQAGSIVTQPLLPGVKGKVPDFLYFTGDSGEITVVLIEIESPLKKWFNQDGTLNAKASQAAQQLVDWKNWFGDHKNIGIFEELYGVRNSPLTGRLFKQKYVLVLGRRDDIRTDAERKAKPQSQRVNEEWMTYDRLEPNPDFDLAPSVRLDRSGGDPAFRAVHVPPTFKVGPAQMDYLSDIEGLEEAIEANDMIEAGRKKFLAERLHYWRSWLKEQKKAKWTVTRSSDMAGE